MGGGPTKNGFALDPKPPKASSDFREGTGGQRGEGGADLAAVEHPGLYVLFLKPPCHFSLLGTGLSKWTVYVQRDP